MVNYIIRRLLLMIPTLFLLTLIVFLAVRFIPGSVVDQMLAEMAGEGATMQNLTADVIRHQLGLDIPVYVQYWNWLTGVLQGDLGKSLWTKFDVLQGILNALPISLELAIIAVIVGTIFAIPIGIYSAVRQDTGGDYVGRTIAIVAISVPSFWVATLVIVYPSIWWGWTPSLVYIPFQADPIGNLGMFIIPGVIMGLLMSGTTMRMTRTMMLEVLRQDYVRTAWAKGLSERTVVMRHALKNALIPVVTIIGNHIPVAIAGTVILESIFNLPGMGRLMISALNKRDYPIISGINLFFGVVMLINNLLIDLTYAYLDPRIRYK